MKTSQTGIDLIKQFEGFQSLPYRDGNGVLTLGYGHTQHVRVDTPTITEQQGEELLREDIARAEAAVNLLVRVPLSQNQFDALVSLVFNLGPVPLKKHLGEYLNAHNYVAAANQFPLWDHDNGKVVPGLLRRRKEEMALFERLEDATV